MNIDDTIKSNFQFIGSCILRIDLKNDLLFLPEADELKLVMGAEYEINQIEYTDDRILGTVTLEVKARAKRKKALNRCLLRFISKVALRIRLIFLKVRLGKCWD